MFIFRKNIKKTIIFKITYFIKMHQIKPISIVQHELIHHNSNQSIDYMDNVIQTKHRNL